MFPVKLLLSINMRVSESTSSSAEKLPSRLLFVNIGHPDPPNI